MRALLAALLLAAFPAPAADFTTERDVEYGRAGGRPLLLDVLTPSAPAEGRRAAIVAIHGGGWIGGDKRDMSEIAGQHARAGYVVFNLNYRLAFGTDVNWPAPFDDCQRAVRWVRANADKYGIDPKRIGAIGASAGGHLAALLGLADTRDNTDTTLAAQPSRVQCVVNIFGPCDLTKEIGNTVPLGPQADWMIRTLLGGTPAEKAGAAREASPIFRIDAKAAPFLHFHGRKDQIVPWDHSLRLHEALQKAGIESTLVLFDDEGHGFAQKQNRERFQTDTAAFFKKHLAP